MNRLHSFPFRPKSPCIFLQNANGSLLLVLLLPVSTARYEGSSHRNVFGHLTNSSINRKSPFASHDKDVIGDGCKWTLRRLRGWVEESFKNGGERWSRLWAKIRSMICLSVMTLADIVPRGPSPSSCFELFGIDVMVDSTLSRAHLLEINCSPALGLDEDSDRKVKLPLIEDLLDLLDLESSSPSLSPSDDEPIKREKQTSRTRCSKPRDSTPRRYKKSSVTRPLDPQTRIRSRAKHANRADYATDEGLNQRILFSQGVRHDKGRLIDQGNTPLSGARAADPLCPEREDAGTLKIYDGGPLKPIRPITSAGYNGGFELVFPFNEDSQDQARRLSQYVRSGAPSDLVQGCIRAIIAEIKAQERKCIMALRRRPGRTNHKEEEG